MANQKGFGVIESLIVVTVLAVIGFGGYYIYSQNKDQEKSATASTDEVSQTKNEINAETESASTTFKYPGLQNAKEIDVQVSFPKTWGSKSQVWDGDESKNPRNYIEVESSDGIRVSINDADGIGYVCSDDKAGTVIYTVNDVIETKTPSLKLVHIKANKYFKNDTQDSYIIVNSKNWDNSNNPLFTIEKGATYTKVYSEADDCSPIEGPMAIRLGSNRQVNLVIQDTTANQTTSYNKSFDNGFEPSLLEKEASLRAVIESILIESK